VEKTKQNMREKQAQENEFEANRHKLYQERLDPLQFQEDLFRKIVKHGRLDILKYLCEEWLPKYWVPEFLNLSPKEKYEALGKYVPLLRKYNNTELANEEDEKRHRHQFYLRCFQGQSVQTQTRQAYEYFCTKLIVVAEESLVFGEWHTLLYILQFLRTYKRLEHLFLVNLVVAAQNSGNHYIYMDVLQNWKPNAEISEEEQGYIEYVKQNPAIVVRVSAGLNYLNYFDAVVMLQLALHDYKNWSHWMPPRYLISRMKDETHSFLFDWLIERDASLLNWNLIRSICFDETHSNYPEEHEPGDKLTLSGEWKLLYYICTSAHRYLHRLPALEPNQTSEEAIRHQFTQWFYTNDEKQQIEIDDIDSDLLRIVVWLLKNQYLQFYPNFIECCSENIRRLFVIAQALLEKRELVADHFAKALSGQRESIEKIRTAEAKGDIKMNDASNTSAPHYVEKMVQFEVSAARRIVFYMQGSAGYNHTQYVKRGKQWFGENWRNLLKHHVESLRDTRLEQISTQRIAENQYADNKLNNLHGIEKMLLEQSQQKAYNVSENAQEVNDLLNRKKENLLTLTAAREDFDMDDISALTSLL
jgi:hypothetical protein